MNLVYSLAQGFYEASGSKFYAFLEPCSDIRAIRERQAALRAEHPKSVHVVYAARAMNDYAQVAEDFSDDGEPKGSSAAPMLAVLRGAELLGAVYVVRYFGGTLLGIGGLVRAYSAAANDAIAAARSAGALREYLAKENYSLECSYALWGRVEYLLKAAPDAEYCAEFGAEVSVCIAATAAAAEGLKAQLAELAIKLQRE